MPEYLSALRKKRIVIIAGLVAAMLLAVVLWPREEVPFDFLKGFRKDRVIATDSSRDTIYLSEGDYGQFAKIAGKELSIKGWTRTRAAPKAGETWAKGLNNSVWLGPNEIKYEWIGDEIQPTVHWNPQRLAVAIRERKSSPSIWDKILRRLGFW